MSSIARKSNMMNRIRIALMIFILLLIYPVLAIAYSENLSSNPGISSSSVGATIAYLGDARPSKFGTTGITELTKDLNQVVPQSPTGMVDAIIMIGDMDKISQTKTAYAASNVTNIPIFYVVGNHEVGTSGDVNAIRAMYGSSIIPLTPGPAGTDKTTYSFDVGEIHVINTNQYWNGASNDAWFKYGNGEGGYIPDALYNWISDDLSKTSQPWKIVVGHEPLYPRSRHVGDSLDKDPANRNKLQDLFVSRNVAVFVGAHTHYATVNTVGGVYHVDAGVSGQKTVDGEDPFASIFYTHIDAANDLVLTWKHENPTWNSPITKSYTISKVISPNPPINITSYSPISPIINNEGATQTFNLKVNQNVDMAWYINGTLVGLNSSVIAANYSNNSAKSGTWNVSAIANNSNDSAVQTWIWKVSDPIVSGSFINGTVMDSVSKSGLAGVEVLTDTGLSMMTDAAGFYSFEVTPGTEYTLRAAFEPVYYPNSTTVSAASSWVVLRDIELLKKLNGTITGRINN